MDGSVFRAKKALSPEHNCSVRPGLSTGLGLTVTVTVKVFPTHPSGLIGVTVYVAVLIAAVGLIKTSVISASLAIKRAIPPVIPPVTTGAGKV